uniref:NADH-ubiquinone oxidoreductase chain 1 n=1 Tax=Spadella cephaloptera TaxID=52888 RepID=A0A141CKF2_9BILA|nr:NADH dehydrogenase subunit 1 [Spadella cephaloptera]
MVMNYIFQVICVMVATAMFTLLERKTLGYIHLRKGPNKPPGLLVPFADAIKLMTKEYITPMSANSTAFLMAPMILLIIPLLLWSMTSTKAEYFYSNLSVVLILCILSVSVYGTLLAGWSSNSKYALLGAIRVVAQSISYEVTLTVIFLHVMMFLMFSTSLSFVPLFLPMLMITMIFFISCLADTNRSPFDFAEGESELVSGFNTEYSSVGFLIIFLSEYMSILFMSFLVALFFMATNLYEMILITSLIGFLYIWARGTLPRFRYDQLMYLTWKTLLPTSLMSLLIFSCV